MTTVFHQENLVFNSIMPGLKVAKWPSNAKQDPRNFYLENHCVSADLIEFDPLSGVMLWESKWYIFASPII